MCVTTPRSSGSFGTDLMVVHKFIYFYVDELKGATGLAVNREEYSLLFKEVNVFLNFFPAYTGSMPMRTCFSSQPGRTQLDVHTSEKVMMSCCASDKLCLSPRCLVEFIHSGT